MIAKMKLASIVAPASHKEQTLDALRELGILHLAEKKNASPELLDRFAMLSHLSQELKDYAGKEAPAGKLLSDSEFEKLNDEVQVASVRKAELEAARNAAKVEIDKLQVWGSFDPEQVKALQKDGMDFHFYRVGKKELAQLSESKDVSFIRLAQVDKMDTIAVLGKLDSSFPAAEFSLPEKGLPQLEKEVAECEQGIAACKAVMTRAASFLSSYDAQMLKAQNDAEYSSVSHTMGSDDDLVWISGYVPEEDEGRFVEAAKANCWAWSLDDIANDDEHVPTKVKYNKVTALMQPVFDILGTVPGYREYDISFWFLAFFSLFFAMIIGDAGYGVLFLIGAVILNVKSKKVSNANLLLYVLSISTIIWGSLTGTWFGFEEAMHIPFLKALVIPGFANYPEYFNVSATAAQNNIMKFCFSIGAIQLALACIMNIRRKLMAKDLSMLADLGWLMAVCALYFMVLFLVINQPVNLAIVAVIVAVGFLLVVFFGGMSPDKSFSQGLKAGLADAFTDFLNTISAFGNVMSYIRLFAVGMASLSIAQSFNSMGTGFSGPLVVLGVLVIIVGHVLNIVMGILSVVVHGARLNLLEFSGQLGMEWSGTTYDPFRKLDKIKK